MFLGCLRPISMKAAFTEMHRPALFAKLRVPERKPDDAETLPSDRPKSFAEANGFGSQFL
jgi:hypothetical protein